ncbi:MAG TPA: hypothetical protein VJY33_16280 [Isosphaeraceae bacterium]|nr:hypothetical protein [Isosphaeraceae bacterium]
MDTINLNQIAPNRGVASTNYFNGRPLAAEDLTTDQAARRQQITQLGRAVGAGVAYGLQVYQAPIAPGSSGPATSVTVAAGLAVNRRGRPLSLPADIEVALTVTTPSAPSGPGLFADCQPPQSSAAVVSSGVYILTISPASDYEGAVASVDLSGADPTLSGCGSANLVEGVLFRLIGLNFDTLQGVSAANVQAVQNLLGSTDLVSQSLLRNRLAHMFFDTDDWSAWGTNYDQVWAGDSSDEPFGLLGSLRANNVLSDCDVPLAMIYWDQSGIVFVDRWAVRRGIEPIAYELGFPLVASSAHPLARAAFCQFQEQIEWLDGQIGTDPSLANDSISTLFAYLPPVGIVPVSEPSSTGGFSRSRFFGALGPANPTVISLAHLAGLLQKADSQPPFPVASTEVLQLYWVKENYQAVSQGQTTQLYAAFATRALQGFIENDDVVVTLTQAWDNYSRVLRTMAVLPTVLTTASLPVWTAIFAVLQNLVQFTLVKATAAGADDLDLVSFFQTFSDLFTLENTLVQVMNLTFNGDTGLSVRQQQAGALNGFLQGTLDDGSPGLGRSLQATSYPGIIHAQTRINQLVGGWGALSSVGGLNLTFVGRDKGNTVVPNAVTTLTCSVNSQLLDTATVQLSASVVASKVGDWSNAVSVQTVDNEPLFSLDIAPQQSIPFLVKVTGLQGLTDFGDTVRVEVVASLPTQTIQATPLDIDLTLAATGGTEQAYTLSVGRFPPNLPPTTKGQQGQKSSFTFKSTFAATRAPNTVNCTLTVTCTFQGTTRTDWTIGIAGQPSAEVGQTGAFTYSFPLQSPPGTEDELTQVQIAPNFAPDASKSCTFTVNVAGSVIDSQTNKTVALSGSAPGGPFGVTF